MFYTFFFSTLAVITSFLTTNRKIHDNFVYRPWAFGLLFFLNVKIEIEGEENIPQEGAMLLFNHTSLFDIPVLLMGVNKTFRFGAKSELFKVPIFGQAMSRLETLKIHRGDRNRVLKLYSRSVPKMKGGLSYILSPEGGRKTSDTLSEFKSGPFVFAIEAQAPLMPILLNGVGGILPKKKLFPMWGKWSHTVKVKILPSISTKGLQQTDRKDLQLKVYEVMKSELEII